MSELQRPQAVHVVWRDCTSCDAWTMPDEVAELGCQNIETVGLLSWDCPEFICVSVAWERVFGKVAGTFTIPRSQIISVTHIGLPPQDKE
jgi:hypothetical protein